LGQRKWDRGDGHKQKQIKRTPNEMRFDGAVNLFFHFWLVLLVKFFEFFKGELVDDANGERSFLAKTAKACQDLF